MSYVTNVILHIGIREDEEAKIKEINEYLSEFHRKQFVSVDDKSLPMGWYGGTKMLECNLYIGAFNYLDITGLVSKLLRMQWEDPEDLQLILKDQDDDKFSILNLFE